MKVLTIRQPWAQLIAAGVKDVENRTWRTGVRGRIAIHSSAAPAKGADKEAVWDVLKRVHGGNLVAAGKSFLDLAYAPLGAIIATADLVDCVEESDSPWFFGPYGFVLRNVEKLEKPIPAKGKLWFWEFAVEGWKGESDGK